MAKDMLSSLREELKEKYRRIGAENMQETELITLLLSFSEKKEAPQKAEELIREYGSINALADADPQLLMKNSSISEQTAVLIKLISGVSRVLYAERFSIHTVKDAETAKSFFSSHFIGAVGEMLIITALSRRFRVVSTKVLAFGTPAPAVSSYREIADFVLKSDCRIFLAAHNHPFSEPLPSDSDLLFTRNVINTLSTLGAVLADHIIVGRDSALSLRESGLVPEFGGIPLSGYNCGNDKS